MYPYAFRFYYFAANKSLNVEDKRVQEKLLHHRTAEASKLMRRVHKIYKNKWVLQI